MPTNNVFLDANILLEIILDRANARPARKLLNDVPAQPCISALTAHLVVHFGKNLVDMPVLRHFLQDYTVLPLEEKDFEWAFVNMRGTDFEDALQLAVAIRNGSDTFFTFDKNLVKNYKSLPTIRIQLPG
jgi:predicted nucleic acid-binding protein